jgi:hypothetical protein
MTALLISHSTQRLGTLPNQSWSRSQAQGVPNRKPYPARRSRRKCSRSARPMRTVNTAATMKGTARMIRRSQVKPILLRWHGKPHSMSVMAIFRQIGQLGRRTENCQWAATHRSGCFRAYISQYWMRPSLPHALQIAKREPIHRVHLHSDLSRRINGRPRRRGYTLNHLDFFLGCRYSWAEANMDDQLGEPPPPDRPWRESCQRLCL